LKISQNAVRFAGKEPPLIQKANIIYSKQKPPAKNKPLLQEAIQKGSFKKKGR